jgi:hypothetical protein
VAQARKGVFRGAVFSIVSNYIKDDLLQESVYPFVKS